MILNKTKSIVFMIFLFGKIQCMCQPLPEDNHNLVAKNSNPPKKKCVTSSAHRSTPSYSCLTELKAGYFYPLEQSIRKVYGGGVGFQLATAFPVWKHLNVEAALNYFHKQGHSLGGHQKTAIWIIPLSLGLKYFFPMNSHAEYYLSLGPRYFFVHVHNNSHYVDRKYTRTGLGGYAGTGFLFYLSKHWVFDLFAEYSYKRLDFHPSKHRVEGHKVQVGGLFAGAGLGYAF